MKCLIVAAGQGTRLRERGPIKPLIPLKGVPILERVLARARAAGIEQFVVVSGYRGEDVRAALDAVAARDGIAVTHVINESWERANGLSVLRAKPLLNEPFLLTMCDHLVDAAILRDLMAATVEPDTVTLAVDFNINGSINDLEDVTRVQCADGRIERIGKVLREFNAIDTGVFRCSPVIFEALEASAAGGDESISGAMNVLARWGKARVFDIGERLWLDIDDPIAFRKAEDLVETGRL